MRKSVFCLISAGVLVFLSCGNSDALFGKSAKKETVATKLFGTSIDPTITATKDINNIVTTSKKKITSATQKLEKLSMNTKTFDNNTEVGTPLLISANLEMCASILEKISQSLVIQRDGFAAINKAKNAGDENSQKGRRLLIQSVKVLSVAEPLLAMLRGSIAITAKYFEGKIQQINNPGEAQKALKDLATAIADKKNKANGLASLTTAYLKNFSNVYGKLTDKELQAWLKKGNGYAEKFEEVVKLFCALLDVSNKYLETGDPEGVVALGEECELSIIDKQKQQVKSELADVSSQRLVSGKSPQFDDLKKSIAEQNARLDEVKIARKARNKELEEIRNMRAVTNREARQKELDKMAIENYEDEEEVEEDEEE